MKSLRTKFLPWNRLISLLLALLMMPALIPALAEAPITEPQAIVDYLASHDGQLPPNFVTKTRAKKLGWNGKGNLSDALPGYSFGGSDYQNKEGLLPAAPGRTWKECDCYYTAGKRSGQRLCFSNDGLYFYSPDGFKTFTQMYPSEDMPEPEGPIIAMQDIADYLFEHQCLPPNFITKRQAQELGWDSSRNYVSDVAPGCSIGGDRFGNYQGLLPTAKGRQYYECDVGYVSGKRSAKRIVFSNDGLVFYTEDHYNTFTRLYPSR